MPCVTRPSADFRYRYTYCPTVEVPAKNPLILLQVDPGKAYYVKYRPVWSPGGDMKLEKEAIGIKDMKRLKFTQARHFTPPTFEQALSTVKTGLIHADRSVSSHACRGSLCNRYRLPRMGSSTSTLE